MSNLRKPRRALTLIELLIALTVTVIIGLAVAAITNSVARSVTSMNDARSALQRAYAAHARIRSQAQNARAFLDADPDRGVALWLNDQRANNRVNLSEIAVLWITPSDEELFANELVLETVAFPTDWDHETTESADVQLTLVDDFFQEILNLRNQGWTQRTVIADAVEEINLSHSAINLVNANRVRLTLSVRVGDDTQDILMAFGLQNHRAPG